MEHLLGVPKGHVDRQQLGIHPSLGALPRSRGRRHEEVQQRHGNIPAGDQHVASGPEAGEQRLGHERGQHRGDDRIHRVAAVAQNPRSGVGGQRVPGGDDPALSLAHPPRQPRL